MGFHELWMKLLKGSEACGREGEPPWLGALGHLHNRLREGHLTRILEGILLEGTGHGCGCEWGTRVYHLASGNQVEDSKEIREWA